MRIWIHIGLQKTGTTALQQWCAQNAAQLREQGLLYLQLREGLPACGPLTQALLEDRPELGAMIETLKAQISRHGTCRAALLSNEGFSQESPTLLRPLIEAFCGHEIGFIVTLRRQDRLAEALYKQVVKFNGASAAPAQFLHSRHLRVLDYAQLLQNWQAAYPKARLMPLLYQEGGQDSIAQMLEALGYGAIVPPESAAFRRNITPAAELIAAYNQVPRASAKALRRANQKLMARFEAQAAGHDDIFDRATALELLQRFEASNLWVLQHYFPERATLFAPIEREEAKPLDPDILAEFQRQLAKEVKRLEKETGAK